MNLIVIKNQLKLLKLIILEIIKKIPFLRVMIHGSIKPHQGMQFMMPAIIVV